eukprot:GHRR01018243.1.p1 GENE.GHRR01018243.1~~GHRR01018243.1.p1  ORF type:complete len:289 (+),score=117.71 GHRR01018243.1:1240-2106(+)
MARARHDASCLPNRLITVLCSSPASHAARSCNSHISCFLQVFPKQLLLTVLPPEVDILCTHPMFGPDSGKGSWDGLNFMYDPVRVGDDPKRQQRLELFLQIFKGQGCRMVEMTCEEHDRQAASTQFVTHTVGRMLGAMNLQSTDINTKGFEALLQLVNNTNHDSFDLYYGLFLYNTNATDELERLEQAFEHVKKQLLGRLHEIARQQLFPAYTPANAASTPAAAVSGSNTPGRILGSSRSSTMGVMPPSPGGNPAAAAAPAATVKLLAAATGAVGKAGKNGVADSKQF